MSAFDRDTLWNKSKLFLDRALVARDDQRDDEFHLWAALAIEVLGKASLAHVHPALVADPTHFPSMLAAVGHKPSIDLKSIAAGTLFDRLKNVVPGFDQKMQDSCSALAQRRNAELHSGLSPMTGLDQRVWVPVVWLVVNTLVVHQGRTLDDLVGADEARRIATVLKDTAALTQEHVLARIARRGALVEERYGSGTKEWADARDRAEARRLPKRFENEAEAFEEHPCPACGMKGWLFGAHEHDELIEVESDSYYIDEDGEPGLIFFQFVEITYTTERFVCSECGLDLKGRDEIAIATLPHEFQHREEHEPDYEPDYGND